MLKESLYYSKILLFGEYGIIHDSMGLSIPYNDYNGKFLFSNVQDGTASTSNENLKKFLNHLCLLEVKNELPCVLDLTKFAADLEKGMHFDSSIPQGFGVGSSGAIVAAVYDHYCTDKIPSNDQLSNEKFIQLKAIFGNLESYYHGKSSGLDPLICYLNLPILIKSKEELGTVGLPESNTGKGAIFLMNTGKTGKTQPLVQHFMERCKEEGFRNMLKGSFKKYNDACIDAFLNKKTHISNNDFVILSRISKSKNLELSIDCFLKSKFNQDSITVIGDAVTDADMEYKAFLAEKYRTKNNVIFKGMIPHKELPDVLRSYSYHINSTPPGFYDKSVLETLAAGIYNFYLNADYDKHFDPKSLKYTKFSSKQNSLTDLLNAVYELNDNKILEIVSFAQNSVSKESVETISDRVLSTVEN